MEPTTQQAPVFLCGSESLVRATIIAGQKINEFLARQNFPRGALRVAIVGGGCSGLSYKLDLVEGPRKGDILVETAGARVVVDPKSALFLSGSELDYSTALINGGFKIKNPNATSSCSCGESFSV